MQNSTLPSPGTRIKLNNFFAKVRFVGPVEGTSGIWFGVEWDIPDRGKHSGSKDGKQYFTCGVRGAGSFIRPNPNIIYGVSFLEATRSKYIEAPHGSTTQEKVILGSSQGAIEVEAVDLDKIRAKFGQLDRLREISLDNENVAHADSPGDIHRTCPNVRGLDLSMNLFSNWEVVASIAKELPLLQRLALNRNRLQLSSSVDFLHGAFANVLEVQLNDTLLTWSEMEEITSFMPRLQSVEIGYNRLISLPSDTSRASSPGIQILNFDGNMLSEWTNICSALKRYPLLQRLILTSNRVEAIPFPSEHDQTLASIQHISLSDNPIREWASVDALSYWFPTLKSLTLSGTPLVHGQGAGQSSRPFIIARIPSLMTLDGASVSDSLTYLIEISSKERTDCELFYLSCVTREVFADDAERSRAHHQWEALCKKHGRPENKNAKLVSQDKLSSRLIEVEIIDSSALSHEGSEKVLRVLPTMSLRNLRLKIYKLLKLNSRTVNITCYLRMGDGSLSELEPEYDSRELDWLGLENGSQIVYKTLH